MVLFAPNSLIYFFATINLKIFSSKFDFKSTGLFNFVHLDQEPDRLWFCKKFRHHKSTICMHPFLIGVYFWLKTLSSFIFISALLNVAFFSTTFLSTQLSLYVDASQMQERLKQKQRQVVLHEIILPNIFLLCSIKFFLLCFRLVFSL